MVDSCPNVETSFLKTYVETPIQNCKSKHEPRTWRAQDLKSFSPWGKSSSGTCCSGKFAVFILGDFWCQCKVLSNWSDLLASPALSKGLDYTTLSNFSQTPFFPYHFYKYSSAEILFKHNFVNNTPPQTKSNCKRSNRNFAREQLVVVSGTGIFE